MTRFDETIIEDAKKAGFIVFPDGTITNKHFTIMINKFAELRVARQAPTVSEAVATVILDPSLLPAFKAPLIEWHVDIKTLPVDTKLFTAPPQSEQVASALEKACDIIHVMLGHSEIADDLQNEIRALITQPAQPKDCVLSDFSSRTCEQGTNSCEVNHTAQPESDEIKELSSIVLTALDENGLVDPAWVDAESVAEKIALMIKHYAAQPKKESE